MEQAEFASNIKAIVARLNHKGKKKTEDATECWLSLRMKTPEISSYLKKINEKLFIKLANDRPVINTTDLAYKNTK
jgi:hypothetical protein